MGSIGAYAMVLARRAGVGSNVIGLTVAVSYLPLAMAWLGPLACRRIPIGLFHAALRGVAASALLVAAIWPSLPALLVGTFGALFFGPLADSVYPALFRLIYQRADQARLMGILYGAKVLAGAMCVLTLGQWMDHLSIEASVRVLGAMGALGVVSSLVMFRFRRLTEPPMPPAEAHYRPQDHPEFRKLLQTITVYGVGVCLLVFVSPILWADRSAFAFRPSQVGYLTACAFLTQMAVSVWFARRARVTASNRLMGVPWMLQSASMFTATVLLLLPGGREHAFWPMLAAVAVNNMGVGYQLCAQALMVNAMAAGHSALRFQAMQFTVIGVRGVVVGLAAGYLYQYVGLYVTTALAGALMFTGGVLALIRSPRHANPNRSDETTA